MGKISGCNKCNGKELSSVVDITIGLNCKKVKTKKFKDDSVIFICKHKKICAYE